ncbi:hypothetical protein [Candidatus Poriferisodalis sp.]|uniref:hypothetical protein n=1 Tax=Candidatus Poriferisodalis sp. TaxID=3101277 RepID=UPI003B017EFE
MATEMRRDRLTERLARSDVDVSDDTIAERGVGTIHTLSPETIDNDQESWLLGVVPPG